MLEKRSQDSLWLWPGEPPCSSPEDDFRPWLEVYSLDTQDVHGAVLVCPGGGYVNRAPHEAEPIARRFNDCGFHAFVVQYRVSPHRHPAPLLDVSRALRIIRANAGEWRVDPERIAVCGFSAGGHLTASLGVHYGMDALNVGDDLDAISARPDALILGYPVITAGEFGHRGCFDTSAGTGCRAGDAAKNVVGKPGDAGDAAGLPLAHRRRWRCPRRKQPVVRDGPARARRTVRGARLPARAARPGPGSGRPARRNVGSVVLRVAARDGVVRE